MRLKIPQSCTNRFTLPPYELNLTVLKKIGGWWEKDQRSAKCRKSTPGYKPLNIKSCIRNSALMKT